MGSRHQSLVPVSLSLHLHHSPSGDDHHDVGESSVTAQSEVCSQMSNVAQAVFVFVFCCSLLSQRVFKSICAGYTGCPKGHRELPHRRASIISRLPPYINIGASFEMRVKLFLNIGVRNLRCILNVIFWGLRLHPSCTWVNYP